MDLFSQPQEPTDAPDPRYSEQAIWLCENRKTRFKTRIHGALAQILTQYPADYKLKLLSSQETTHEHIPSTH